MNDELNLVRDLAVILISAGVFTIISKALKQPLILGYIIAGFLIGPNVPFFLNISSAEAVHQWSEIGLIFMMFGLGLEFSFRKLLKVGSGALVTAGAKFLGVFVVGFIVGQALGWSVMESIFLAGLMSMSSTAVVLKSYEDMGLKDKPYAGLVFGTLVVEDLIAILLMVLLSTLAVSNQFAGGALVGAIAKLIFFIVLVFIVGIYVIPSLFRRARKYLNDEILLLVSIGLCFAMVSIASAAGFSTALGAFVMGSILAETIESEHIEHLVSPIKDLFGAIFFVSVGMMVAPDIILHNWFIILLLALLVIVTHIVFSATGILLTGNGFENAVHTGFSLAQLGEFGFIIASVGVSLGVMRDFIYPVIVAVSVITTFTTPYMIKAAAPSYAFLLRRLPASVLGRISQMENHGEQSAAEKSDWRKLLGAYFTRLFLYGVLLVAIMIASQIVLEPLVGRMLPSWNETARNLLSVVITLAAMSPFLYGFAVNSGTANEYARKLMSAKRSNIWPIFGLLLARFFIAIALVMFVISTHFHLAGWAVLLIVIGGLAFFFIARRNIRGKSTSLEARFFDNLNQKEIEAMRKAPVTASIKAKMEGYDIHLESIVLSADSEYVGRPLKELPIRERSGANIIKISRGSRSILVPDGNERVYPGDALLAVGTGDQLSALKALVSESVRTDEYASAVQEFEVVPVDIEKESYLCGKTLKSLDLRKSNCMIISVLRDGQMIANPSADLIFREGDRVWIAGEPDSLEYLTRS
ncbi:MAG: cation:proton antiporter [Bacteroidales bacterium]|nr:cation:proton antiporter [Bacteroidales bacterium]